MALPPSPLSIKDGEGEEVLANELLRLLEARYGATVAHLRRIFFGFSLSLGFSVWSAGRFLFSPPIQNRACNFRFTRLLSVWSFVTDTIYFAFGNTDHIFSSFLIVAMPMVDAFVFQSFSTTKSGWDAVIDFHQVSLLKVESASRALPLL